MKFIVDAHLPRRLCTMLEHHGHDAIHTLDLPAWHATKDGEINRLSFDEQRVVVSKDTDFFYSHLLHSRPWKLLMVKTGNLSTQELRELIERNIAMVEAAFQTPTLVEIDRLAVTPVA